MKSKNRLAQVRPDEASHRPPSGGGNPRYAGVFRAAAPITMFGRIMICQPDADNPNDLNS